VGRLWCFGNMPTCPSWARHAENLTVVDSRVLAVRERSGYRSLLVALLLLPGLAASAAAQLRENFESPDPIWKLANADCGVRVISHKRTFEQAHGDASSEHIRLVAGQGTHLYYTLPVDRSPIIDETRCSLWLRSDRARLQLMARVVLPRALDERTGKPISTLLQGSEYGEVGAWQNLQVKDVPKLLSRQLVVLRRQFGPHVDAAEAYIDLLVINAYGGPGETNLWIDDLELLGVSDPDWAKKTTPAAPTVSARSSSPESAPAPAVRPAVVNGSVLLVENRPMLVRAIEHRGESMEVFKALGFNTVWLSAPPTVELNEEAKKFGLWLISPPPELATDPASAARLDRVVSWQLGSNLGSAELASTRSLATELRSIDRTLRRPLVCGVRSDAWSYSREADLLLWETPPLFGPRDLTLVPPVLQAKAQQARVGTPFWATVHSEPARPLLEQLNLLDPSAPIALSADLEQVRQATWAALASGARGLLFRSSARLDGDDEAVQQRAAVLRLVNLELNLIEPWFAGGTPPQELSTGDPTLTAVMLQTERSRLLLLTRPQPLGHFVMPPIASDTMLLAIPGVPSADRFYHLTADGLRELQSPAGSSGSRIVVPEAGHTAIVAITQDSLVIQHLTAHAEAQRREGVETRLRLAANGLTHTAFVVEQIKGNLRPPPESEAMLRESQRYLRQADQLLVRGDVTGCYRHTRRVETLVAQARRTWWDSVRGLFPSPLASPCCASFDTLPSHVRLAFRLQQATWSRNGLPAGDCEHLEQLLRSGWQQQRHDSPDVQSSVELSNDTPHAGASSIRLVAATRSDRRLAFDEPAVSLVTAPLQARAGQIARLHGFVRVPQPLQGAAAALHVYDNQAGPSLADAITHAPAWREFTLYRAIPRDGTLTLTFALHGIGEAFIDDVTIELVDAQ
jgi:hypothetical protein